MDCRLLELTEDYKIIPSSAAIAPVSVVYECNDKCKFIAGTKQTVDREEYKGFLGYVHKCCNFYFVLMCIVLSVYGEINVQQILILSDIQAM